MKRRFWIGGVLLLMIFTGMTGCGGPKEPPPEHMLDGPDMMYTPEDQTPYAGTWQSRDGFMPSNPATSARSVPWPFPVSANEP